MLKVAQKCLKFWLLVDELVKHFGDDLPFLKKVPKRFNPSRDVEVQNTDKEFGNCLELLRQSKSEEVKITPDAHRLTIKAQHEMRDKQGLMSVEVTRVYKWPKGVDPKSVVSSMTTYKVHSIKNQKLHMENRKDTDTSEKFKG